MRLTLEGQAKTIHRFKELMIHTLQIIISKQYFKEDRYLMKEIHQRDRKYSLNTQLFTPLQSSPLIMITNRRKIREK